MPVFVAGLEQLCVPQAATATTGGAAATAATGEATATADAEVLELARQWEADPEAPTLAGEQHLASRTASQPASHGAS